MTKRVYLMIGMLSIIVTQWGCSAQPFTVKTDVEITLEAPQLISATLASKNIQSLSFTWAMEGIETAKLVNAASLFFNIYYTKTPASNWQLFETNIPYSTPPITFITTKNLTEGFDTYHFRVNYELEFVDSLGSNVKQIAYTGAVSHTQTISIFNNDAFNTPSDVVIDSNNNFFVSDTRNHRILKFDSSGNYVASFGSIGSGSKQFNHPTGLGIDSNDIIYVADSNNNRIVQFNPNNFSGSFTTETNGFNFPQDVAIDSSGTILVSDLDNNKVHTKNGIWSSSGSFGSNTGNYKGPAGIDTLNSTAYIADQHNSRIALKLGNAFAYIGSKGAGYAQFQKPKDIAVDGSRQEIYVVDAILNRIQILQSNGNFIATLGTTGTDTGEFKNPSGIAYRNNVLIVADTGNNRIQLFQRVSQ